MRRVRLTDLRRRCPGGRWPALWRLQPRRRRRPRRPSSGTKSDDKEAAAKLGFPSTATKNTIRVGGGDAAADAAGVASAVFPGTSDATRPTAVVLVDKDDWQAGVTAAVLARQPDRRADPALRRRRAAAGHRRHAQAAEAQGLRPLQGRPGDPHRRQARPARAASRPR